jgi:hypothetical protein
MACYHGKRKQGMLKKICLLLLLTGCAPAAVQTPAGPAQPELAQELMDSTALRRPLHLVFSWNFTESSARFSGQGATRIEPPYRARLDLFGPRGETYLAAAAEGDELRLPPNMPSGLRAIVPPVPLLWSALGVLRAPAGATLASTQQRADTLLLGYVRGEERWSFRAVAGRLQYVEWTGPESGRKTVELRGTAAHRLPAVAVYRDWPAFRELTLTLDRVNEVASFPADTWYPDR